MRTLFILFALFISSLAFAQPRGDSFGERISYGGNIGFAFGNETIVNVSPRVGYYVTDNFMPGIAVSYMYYKNDFVSDTRMGGSAFARYFLSEEIFLQAESEMLQTTVYAVDIDGSYRGVDKEWINTTMVGGGYNAGGFTISAMYIVNHDPDTSPYGRSPIIVQGGIMF